MPFNSPILKGIMSTTINKKCISCYFYLHIYIMVYNFRSSDKKLNSDYYYKCLINPKNGCNFKTGQPYDLSIPYFCGHDPRCMILNNDWALDQAKNNVIKYFPVVGVLEELNATLEILEDKIPYFFKGARRVYEKDLLYLQTKRKKLKAPKVIVSRLEEALINEIDFYEWIRSRLFRQLKILYGDHNQN
ncbi:unnamed protein product [Psylliodes chrysocephalus]|uniref:Uncharacterized protein n=1 Tax=Psylliodes chrysocephalus TaxID=3402493 RepID=A0A9P0CKB4_9CUCU|nr:unnamed protein product [Psylliodes chrysocephala]